MTVPFDAAGRAREIADRLVRVMPLDDGAWCVDVATHAFIADPDEKKEDAEYIAGALKEQLAAILARALTAVRDEEQERAANKVPDSWVDPLLTGPDAVLKGFGPWAGPDIERLLNAIQARIRAAAIRHQEEA
jgi:hypothetical protein